MREYYSTLLSKVYPLNISETANFISLTTMSIHEDVKLTANEVLDELRVNEKWFSMSNF